MVAGVVDSHIAVHGCDSKKIPNNASFSCPIGYGVGDELAVGVRAGGCKMVSLGVGELA